MQLPITLKLRPSRKLALLLFVTHLAALFVLGSIELPDWIRLVLPFLILISLWNGLNHMYGARRIVLLTIRDKEVLEYVRLNGESGEAGIDLQSTVSLLLTVILLKQKKRLEALVLLPDSLSHEDYRCLRLWLHWQTSTN